MSKKVAYIFLQVMLAVIPATYLIFSSRISRKEAENTILNNLEIRILDSTLNRFVSKEEIVGIIIKEGINIRETKIKNINTYSLEEAINRRTAVRISQVSLTGKGKLRVDILQRRPIIRIETTKGGFYMDDEAYIFPLMDNYSSYVPIVTGYVDIEIPEGKKGEGNTDDYWTSKIHEFAIYMEKSKFWNSMIEQIHISNKGILSLTPRIGKTDIIFGDPENIERKFKKLYAFYSRVVPEYGWDKYKTVDLGFGDQLVCTKR
jgi:cell division protein FtsQ